MKFSRYLVLTILVLLVIGFFYDRSLSFKKLKLGDELPPISLSGGSGSNNIEDISGKVSILLFARPGESLSQKAATSLAQVLATAQLEDITALAIVPEGTEAAAGELGRTFVVIVDKARKIEESFGVLVYPSTAVIDRSRKLACYLPLFSPEFTDQIRKCLIAVVGESAVEATPVKTDGKELETRRKLEQALGLIESGATEEGEKSLREISSLYPRYGDAQMSLGLLLLEKGELAEAKQFLQQAIRLKRPVPKALLGLGITLRRLGELDDAVQVLNQALASNYTPANCHYQLGLVFEAKRDWEEAYEHYLLAAGELLDKSG